jgi:hypothetical protein
VGTVHIQDALRPVVVYNVVPGSAAYTAGVRPGDHVLKLESRYVTFYQSNVQFVHCSCRVHPKETSLCNIDACYCGASVGAMRYYAVVALSRAHTSLHTVLLVVLHDCVYIQVATSGACMRARVLTNALYTALTDLFLSCMCRPYTRVETAAANAAFMQGSRGQYELSANEKINMLVWSPAVTAASSTTDTAAVASDAASAASVSTQVTLNSVTAETLN